MNQDAEIAHMLHGDAMPERLLNVVLLLLMPLLPQEAEQSFLWIFVTVTSNTVGPAHFLCMAARLQFFPSSAF